MLCVIIRVSVFNFLNMNINPLRPKYKIFALVSLVALMPFFKASCSKIEYSQGYPYSFTNPRSTIINIIFGVLLFTFLFGLSKTKWYKSSSLRAGLFLMSFFVHSIYILSHLAFFLGTIDNVYIGGAELMYSIGVLPLGRIVYLFTQNKTALSNPRYIFTLSLFGYFIIGFLSFIALRTKSNSKKLPKQRNLIVHTI